MNNTFEKQCRVSTCHGFRGYKSGCAICGIPGPTKCTPQANCLTISLEAELKIARMVKIEFNRLLNE